MYNNKRICMFNNRISNKSKPEELSVLEQIFQPINEPICRTPTDLVCYLNTSFDVEFISTG